MSKILYNTFNAEQLQTEYSPSSMIDDFMIHINEYIDYSKSVLDNPQNATLNISYCDKDSQSYDFFGATANDTGHLHIYIHGGYWQELSKQESCFMVPQLQSDGINVAVVDYTLAPQVSISEILNECENAIAHIYAQANSLGFDTNKITISGSSAGGHLSTCLGLVDWRKYNMPQDVIKGIISVSGIYDITPIKHTYINDALNLNDDEIKNLSPLLKEKVPSCPMVIAWGDIETSEFKRQSNDYIQKLSNLGNTPVVIEVPQKNHFNVIMDIGKKGTALHSSLLQLLKI